jgi:hypothetical protein
MNDKDIRPRNGMGDSVECEQSLNRCGLEKWPTPMVLEIWCFMRPEILDFRGPWNQRYCEPAMADALFNEGSGSRLI